MRDPVSSSWNPFNPNIPSLETLHRAMEAELEEQQRAFDNQRVALTARMISTILDTLAARDTYTRGHCERVADYALSIAREIGLPGGDMESLRIAAVFHDLGKIGVRDEILLKPGTLSEHEYTVMKRHPIIAYDILKPMKSFDHIQGGLPGIRHHHERIDGRGYPDGLAGEVIPVQARIIAVAETFDAMTSTQPYRPAMRPERALDLMNEVKGTQLDQELVEAFVATWRRAAR